MSDEFYSCGSCNHVEPKTRTEYTLLFDLKDMEKIEEVLETRPGKEMELSKEQVDKIKEAGINYEDIDEIEVCCECDGQYSPNCVGRTN